MNQKDLSSWMQENKYDAIIHLAAIVPIDFVNKHKKLTYNVNVKGTENLIKSITKFQPNVWLLYISTAHIYGYSNKLIKETNKIDPINYYAQTKYLGETILNNYKKKNEFKLCIARVFSIYHKTQKIPFFYPAVLNNLKKSKNNEIRIFSANNIRDFSNAEDVVDKLIFLYQISYDGIINIGTGRATSLSTFIKTIIKKPSLRIFTNNKFKRNKLVANVTKFKNLKKNSSQNNFF